MPDRLIQDSVSTHPSATAQLPEMVKWVKQITKMSSLTKNCGFKEHIDFQGVCPIKAKSVKQITKIISLTEKWVVMEEWFSRFFKYFIKCKSVFWRTEYRNKWPIARNDC